MPGCQILKPLGAALALALAAAGGAHAALALETVGAPFASTAVGALSAAREVVVRNKGAAEARIGMARLAALAAPSCDGAAATPCAAAPPADFFVADDSCSGQLLPAGAACVIRLHFAPNAEGERAAQLVLGEPGEPAVDGLALRGSGAAGSAVLDPLDCVLNWAERMHADVLAPGGTTRSAPFLRARCYAGDTLCLGAELPGAPGADPEVYLFHAGSAPQVQALGGFSQWAAVAQCAGTDGPIDMTGFERPYAPQDGRDPPAGWKRLAQDPFTVFRSAEGLRAAWLDAHRDLAGMPVPAVPAVDFARYIVVGATDGGCQARTIERIRQSGQQILVHLQPAETAPGQACGGFSQSDFVLIPRTSLPVRFPGVDARLVREW